jgi:hypothetical protein
MTRLGVLTSANTKPNYDVITRIRTKVSYVDSEKENIPVPPPPLYFSASQRKNLPEPEPKSKVKAKDLKPEPEQKEEPSPAPVPTEAQKEKAHKMFLRTAFKPLLLASYKTIQEAKEIGARYNYILDEELSTENTHVYVNSKDGIPLIVHRGSTTAADWLIEDALIITGLVSLTSSPRLEFAKEITTKVEAKYNKPTDSFGHSLAGRISELSGANGYILTYNKAAGPIDIGKPINPKQTDYRTAKDFVSLLATTQRRQNKLKTIADPGLFNAHTPESLPTIAEELRRRV